jgi:glucokinase
MSNINWVLHGPQLARHFGIGTLRLINDFQATAYALPQLRNDDCYALQQGGTAAPRRLAVLGPGTGLGGAVLEKRASGPRVIPCEPGQMDIAPRDALQAAVWAVLQRQHPRIYAELLLSGAGLQRLYHALGLVEGRDTHRLEAAGITRAGLAGSDPLCVATLEQFCALLGAACANFLLANGCYQALYLAGGILPRMLAFLRDSPFLVRFHDAGPLQATLQRTEINVITHRYPGLLGAGHAPLGDTGV